MRRRRSTYAFYAQRLYNADVDTRAGSFDPKVYPDVPLYNIQAVSTATSVPAITLRSWERRYGIPRPKRDAKGYRLYSERDIAVVQWLRDKVERGVGISRAVHMLELIERGEPESDSLVTFDFESLRERLLEAVGRMDEAAMSRIVAEALMVATVEEVSLHVLQPVLYDVGESWADGTMSVTAEHVGSNLLRAHLAQLVRITPPPYHSAVIIVGCAPGELHDIGALMLALFLRRRGYEVIYAGANIEPESLIRDAQRLQPAAICLSASTAKTAASLRDLLSQLQDQCACLLAFGGKAFNDQRDLASSLQGTYLGADASTATETLQKSLDTIAGIV